MLIIQTDLSEIEWLSYLMEEFCRIEKAEFSIQISKESNPEDKIIKYNKTESTTVYQCNFPNLKNGIKYLNEEFFVLKDSIGQKNSEFNYDLFWNAFYFLSRKDEYDLELAGIKLQSYSNKSSRINDKSWLIPIVNYYFGKFKAYIQSRYPSLKFGKADKAKIDLSHDLDYLKKTTALRIKQSAFNILNALKYLDPKKLSKAFKFFFSNQQYWNFDYWTELESKYQLKSTFYIYANAGSKGFKKWLMDPAYTVGNDDKLKAELIELQNKGWELGLHGSFESAVNFELLEKEKEILEESVQQEITKTRQHWLRYEEGITPFIHERLFEQDATIGWNNRIGFRAGIASKYRPYCHSENRPFKHFVIPQIIMDANIYDYGYKKENEILAQCLSLLDKLKSVDNAHFSISWHPRTCNPEYGWHKSYKKLIQSW